MVKIEENELTPLYWASELNPWMSFIIIIRRKDIETAKSLIEDAVQEFFSDQEPYNCIGDILDKYLEEVRLPIEYRPNDILIRGDKDDEVWDYIVDELARMFGIITMN